MSLLLSAAFALAQHQGHDGMQMPADPRPQAPTSAPAPQAPPPATGSEHAGMDAGPPPGLVDVTGGRMPAALGPYSMSREASGTAWQPDSSALC